MNLEEHRAKLRSLEQTMRNVADPEIARVYAEKAAEQRSTVAELEKAASAEKTQILNLAKAATAVQRGGVAGDLVKGVVADLVKAVIVDEVTSELDKSDKRWLDRIDASERRAFGMPAPAPASKSPEASRAPTDAEKAAEIRRMAEQISDRAVREAYLEKAAELDEKALDPASPGSGVAIMTAIEGHLSKAAIYDTAADKATRVFDAQTYRSLATREREAATEMRSKVDKGAKS
jgi:hypothetical protein